MYCSGKYCIERLFINLPKQIQTQFMMKNVVSKGSDIICNTGSISQREKNQYQGVLEPNKSDEKC